MSMQFYSVNTEAQTAMGGTQLHSPQSVFQHTMSHHSTNLQNEAQWFGTPQVPPMSMPWSLPASQKPDLVYFTAKQNFALGKGHIKRKLETPDLVEMRPRKQLITEEKMAQQFRGLHISNNSMNLQEAGPSTSTISSSNQSNTLDLDLTSSLGDKNNFEPRLVISDEIKRLQQEPILPTSLVTQSLSKLERPTMALVLWEPSSRHFPNFPRETPTPVSSSDDNNNNNNNNNVNSGNINNENNSNNNNNESIPDLNQAMTASGTIQSLEPMDL